MTWLKEKSSAVSDEFACGVFLYQEQLKLNQSRIDLHNKVRGHPTPGQQQVPSAGVPLPQTP